MAEEKVQAYKVISHQFLTLVRAEFSKGSNCYLGKILEIFQKRNLHIRFFTSDRSSTGDLAINLAVDLLSEETAEEMIDELRNTENQYELALISQVSMIMIYGPHFGEVPGIAGLALSTLTGSGITPLAMNASSSSLACLLPSVHFKPAMESLHAVFEPPQ